MTEASIETLTVTVERDLPYPPEKIWRALTQPHLIADWLMSNDFAPQVGRAFRLTADWGGVDCEVLTVEPQRVLAYSWAAMGVKTVVTWTLELTDAGTHLRMEQAGFRADQPQAYGGAQWGWKSFFAKLEEVVARD